jgi:AcrR family transcriptional regulator
VEKTKFALTQALVRLMIENGYEAITVADITERANVGRSTFYAHYADKEDLLQESLQGLRQHLTTATPVRNADEPVHPALRFSLPMLLHVLEVRELFCALAGKRHGAPVQTQLHSMLTELVRERLEQEPASAAQPPALVAEAIAGAFLAMTIWWMSGHEELSAEDVDRSFRALVTPGLLGEQAPTSS